MLRYFKYKTPFKSPFVTALGEFTTREGIVLVFDDGDIRAFGEVSPLPGFSKETLAQVESVLIQNRAFLANGFIDQTSDQIITVLDQIHEFPSLSFGLDMLSHDLKAKRSNQSLSAQLFNTQHQSVRSNTSVGINSPKESISVIRSRIAEGFSTIKLKVGQDFEIEKSLLHAIRNEFPELNIRIDANQAWEIDEAIKNLNELSPLDIEYCEQPVSANDIDALKMVTNGTEMKIAADEAVGNRSQVTTLIEQHCCDLIILKPALIGLFNNINVTKRLAESHNMEVVFTTLLDGRIGRKVTAILASGLGSRQYAHGLATGSLLNEQIGLTETINGGAYQLSNSDGIGVTIDLNLLEEII